jgi:hypothetical protein
MLRMYVARPVLLSLTVAALLLPGLGATCASNPPTDLGSGDGLTGKFVGAERCAQCHLNIHTQWAETLHAGALDTLTAIGRDTNAQCLPCHTVGFGEPGGFVDAVTTGELAGVQCENCHGAALDHVQNVEDETLRPTVSIDAAVCGKCHTDSHHPTFEQWSGSGHGKVQEEVAAELSAGESADSCGWCHSGDVRFVGLMQGLPVNADLLSGVPVDRLNAVTCVMCHEPHGRTGKAVAPEAGRDYQLRFAEATSPTPTNVTATIAPAFPDGDLRRYNVCGQCHHDRGRDWTATSRGSHHSIQSNVYIGEMPMPAGSEAHPLVPNTRSAHRFVPQQCATCHMHRTPFVTEDVPAQSGHTFAVNTKACSAVGCHPTEADAVAVMGQLQKQVQASLDNVLKRLGDPSTWQYSQTGGPKDQSTISDEIKKVRFLYNYVSYDGSRGVHNPAYVRAMLVECDNLLTSVGK